MDHVVTKWVYNDKVTFAARVAAIVGVPACGVIATLAGLIFNDMREDVKAMAKGTADIKIAVSVQGAELRGLEQRVNRLEDAQDRPTPGRR